MNDTRPDNVCDVVVAGAGPAGAVAALVLARAGRRVRLVHEGREGMHAMGESLIGAARPLLRDLGLLDVVNEGRHLTAVGNSAAWGSPELITTDFIRDPYGPGWHLNRALFDATLRDHAATAGAGLMQARITGIRTLPDGWCVQLSDNEIHTRWLIDATGRSAVLARMAGASRLRDRRAVALCAWYPADVNDHDARTLIEAVEGGWWYTARVPAGQRVLLLHTDPAHAAPLLRDGERWAGAWRRTLHIAPLIGSAMPVHGPTPAEACGARLDTFAGTGWLAVGDAALSFDPVSSQGIFNALYTGMRGAQAVHAALAGNPSVIDAYTARLEEIRAAYLRHYHHAYRTEGRWSTHPFWRARATT